MIADVLTPNKKRAFAFQAGVALLISVIFACMTFSFFGNPVSFLFAPMIVIFLWPKGADQNISYIGIFIAGIILDILTNSPIGGWALIFLPLFVLMGLFHSGSETGFMESWISFMIWMLGLSGFFIVGWLTGFLKFDQIGMIKMFVLTFILFPPVYFLKSKMRDFLVGEDS